MTTQANNSTNTLSTNPSWHCWEHLFLSYCLPQYYKSQFTLLDKLCSDMDILPQMFFFPAPKKHRKTENKNPHPKIRHIQVSDTFKQKSNHKCLSKMLDRHMLNTASVHLGIESLKLYPHLVFFMMVVESVLLVQNFFPEVFNWVNIW